MAKGWSWASHATVMAVKPTPAATPAWRVLSAPEHTTKPTMPERAPERNMVRMTMRLTFMPAYRAVFWLSPTTAIS